MAQNDPRIATATQYLYELFGGDETHFALLVFSGLDSEEPTMTTFTTMDPEYFQELVPALMSGDTGELTESGMVPVEALGQKLH